jgi:hypothetical protein
MRLLKETNISQALQVLNVMAVSNCTTMQTEGNTRCGLEGKMIIMTAFIYIYIYIYI